jgi:hypothetical protein
MKINIERFLMVVFIIFVGFGCSKTEDISSLRIVGSNTDFNAFKKSNDGDYYFLGKKELNFLNKTFISNLNLSKTSFDSTEIENVVGGKQMLIIQTKEGFSLKRGETNNTFKLTNYGFTLCDKIALIDSVLIVAKGGNFCQPGLPPFLETFTINSQNNLIKAKKIDFQGVQKLENFNDKLWVIDNDGSFHLIALENTELKIKFSLSDIKAKNFNVSENFTKLLISTNEGVIHYKINEDDSLTKINEIRI